MQTQRDQILAALKAGESITPQDALRRFGCFRLAARIAELREQGHLIEKVPPRKGERYATYRLIHQPLLFPELEVSA